MSESADYPGALWVPAHQSNYRRAGRRGFKRVIIHCTDGRANALPVAQMWQEDGHRSSAHFIVGQDGAIIQSVRIADVAWHAHQCNADSVGIEHSARTPGELGPNDPGLPPTAAQLVASAKLTAWLCKRGGFVPSPLTIKGHADADPDTTHSDCPEGSGLLLGPYIVLVAARYAALQETTNVKV